MKKLHEAMLSRQYDVALEHGMNALVEMRLTLAAIRHEKEQKTQ